MSSLEDFELEKTSVWAFPERGDWYTHNPKYRGNFAPQIARNVILRYSNEDDLVLDPMVGGGTSLIETKLLNRKGIGYDINYEAIKITKNNLKFECEEKCKYEPEVKIGDVRSLEEIDDCSVDLILTHPPYLNIIKYSNGEINGDLSNITGVKKFFDNLSQGIEEFYRVLKEDSYCAILIGDTRKGRHYVPLSYYLLDRFLKQGFALKEDIIKTQHNCTSSTYWRSQISKYNFMMIMHEHLFIFRKPKENEDLSRIRYSIKK